MSHSKLETEQPSAKAPSRIEIETACVDLICQLEHLIAVGNESTRGDQVEESADHANKMLAKLLDFVETCLTGDAEDKSLVEVNKALRASNVHKEILGNRTWTSTFKGIFNSESVDETAQETHAKLGQALSYACATTLFHAAVLVGPKTPLGQQIEQSTVVFIHEFKEVW